LAGAIKAGGNCAPCKGTEPVLGIWRKRVNQGIGGPHWTPADLTPLPRTSHASPDSTQPTSRPRHAPSYSTLRRSSVQLSTIQTHDHCMKERHPHVKPMARTYPCPCSCPAVLLPLVVARCHRVWAQRGCIGRGCACVQHASSRPPPLYTEARACPATPATRRPSPTHTGCCDHWPCVAPLLAIPARLRWHAYAKQAASSPSAPRPVCLSSCSSDAYVMSATPTNSASARGVKEMPAISPNRSAS